MTEEQQNLTQHSPRAGRRIMIAVMSFVAAMGIAFIFMHRHRAFASEALEDQTAKNISNAPVVTVTTVNMSSADQSLMLPGATAAWYQSMVYARVDGYVKDWKRDIGDQVERGDLLADIETPELDANFTAANAKLIAGQSEVKVAQANADFARSTYDRWWQSPKGVVSEQERQEKKERIRQQPRQARICQGRRHARSSGGRSIYRVRKIQSRDRSISRRGHRAANRHRRSRHGRQHGKHHVAVHDRAIGSDPRFRRCSATSQPRDGRGLVGGRDDG